VTATPNPVAETVVMKFGGSSVAEPEQIRQVARRLVAARERGLKVVGTISAMGRTTESLLELARRVSAAPDPRELDMLLSTGERTACALVAMAVHDLGYEAVSFTGSQAGILTDAVYTKAKIREITPVRVVQALDAGKIVLVAGFQGFSRDTMDVTTLGRGGTDATAVALAAALGASCEIYSDVPGVFTADPRIVSDARKLAVVSYEEMLEMASSGAKVLMLRAVELARGHGVRLHARSTFSDEPGTWVQEDEERTDHPVVCAVTHSDDDVLFTVRGVEDGRSFAGIVDALAAEQVPVDTIVLDAGRREPELAFSVSHADARTTRKGLALAEERIGRIEVDEAADLGKVSIVGAGIRSHPGVAARMLGALGELGIDPRLISTSPIKVSCLIDRADVERGVRALHDAFSLAGEAVSEHAE
jgi:aspartate kinase